METKDIILELRNRAGMSQEELAEKVYVTRQAVHTPAAVRKTKAAIKQAFKNSMEGRGTSLVEIVSTCSAGWKMTPVQSNQWLAENMLPYYPLGDLKNIKD